MTSSLNAISARGMGRICDKLRFESQQHQCQSALLFGAEQEEPSMSYGTVYETRTPNLAEVIEKIGGGVTGATYLIPDLQRGFVWDPQKIEALFDTVIKGWPFGSILLADIGKQALAFSPRSFYGQVYCGRGGQTEGEKWNATLNRNSQKSSSYKLVLDGQQRLQSLLICLGAEVSVKGVVMRESDWLVYNGNKRKRKPKNDCPVCYLALDVGNLTNQLQDNGFDIHRLNFSSQGRAPIFTWVATEKPVNYSNWHWENELPWIQEDLKNAGRITIRLSQLWDCAKDLSEKQLVNFNEKMEELFCDYNIDKSEQREAVRLFVDRLSFIRNLPVNCLCLMSSSTDTPDDEYDEMILNVFTRLNAGGVILRKEDITLSWVRRHWRQSSSTGEECAEKCMKDLRDALHGFGLDLEINELMSVLTGVWACIENDGHIITNEDLMEGERLKAIAVWLSLNWKSISCTIQSVAKSLVGRGLRYKVHFGSLRVLIMLSAWNLAGRLWFQTKVSGARVNVETGFNDIFLGGLSECLDRLVFSGVWTGDWSSPSRMTSVAQMNEKLQGTRTIDDAKKYLMECLRNQMAEMVEKAKVEIENMGIKPRHGVSAYKSFLWVWQRLNESRARYSTILARERNGLQEGIPHVDHCLSSNYWESFILPRFKVERSSQKYEELSKQVNQIGNCTILMDALNISKSDSEGTELERFLSKVVGTEKGKEKEEVENCLKALAIDRLLVYPDDAEELDQLCKAMSKRTRLIKAELVEFLVGSKKRVLDANA